MLLKRIWRVVRSGGDQQIGRRHRCRRLEMMLEKPDLIDADAFGQLDLFELAQEHLHMRRIFARGGGRPYGESHRLFLPVFNVGMQPRQASWSPARLVTSIASLRL